MPIDIGGFPKPSYNEETKKRALELFEASTVDPTIGPTDEETLNEFITFKMRDLESFRAFVILNNLPVRADFITWLNLFAKDWRNVGSGCLSWAQIEEISQSRS